MEKQKSRIQCLERALNLLEAMSRHDGIGVTELAVEVGLHVATTHNILSVCLARNYVLNDHGTYRLGPALAALANRSDPLLNLARLGLPRLEEVTRRTGESAVLGVLSGDRLIMIAATASADGLTCPAVNQVSHSPLGLATGRLLVAHQPARDWRRYIESYARQEHLREGAARPGLDEWKVRLSSLRETDICLVRSGTESGAVAAPIHDARGVVVAALGSNSVGRLADDRHRERWIAAVRDAGRQVSSVLGYRWEAAGMPPGAGAAEIGAVLRRHGKGD